VAAHDDAAAEACIIRIERGDGAALVGRQQILQDGAALGIELDGDLRPVEGVDVGGEVD
jgi:hypothetical protein